METTKIALFKGKKVRKTLHKNEWWFSILDVVAVLTDSPQPKTYWAKMKARDKEISQPFPFWEQLRLLAFDGKMRETKEKSRQIEQRLGEYLPLLSKKSIFDNNGFSYHHL